MYTAQYVASVAVAMTLAFAGVIVGSDAMELSKQQLTLISAGMAALGILATVLPSIRRPPTDERRGLD